MLRPSRETLLKSVRGKNFRRALKAIAELRAANEGELAEIVGAYRAPDEQREFQYRIARIVLAHGVRGLVAEWRALVDPKRRAELISEIDQSLVLWVDEATVFGHHPTGLLDRKILATALERIQARG